MPNLILLHLLMILRFYSSHASITSSIFHSNSTSLPSIPTLPIFHLTSIYLWSQLHSSWNSKLTASLKAFAPSKMIDSRSPPITNSWFSGRRIRMRPIYLLFVKASLLIHSFCATNIFSSLTICTLSDFALRMLTRFLISQTLYRDHTSQTTCPHKPHPHTQSHKIASQDSWETQGRVRYNAYHSIVSSHKALAVNTERFLESPL